MFTVHKNFRFNNWNKSSFLASTCVTCQSPGVLLKGKRSWSSIRSDLENSTPFCETCTLCIVFLCSFNKPIKTTAPCFNRVSTRKRCKSSIYLNTRDDTDFVEAIYEWSSVSMALEQSFFVKNCTRDVLSKIRGSKEKTSVLLASCFGVVNTNGSQSFANSLGRFINCKDTLSWCSNGCSSCCKFVLVLFKRHFSCSNVSCSCQRCSWLKSQS
mmetsp:Transcript_21685/g.28069  ORF Transcript_21685/g.28069 Transcript_21685/m.28069 type:complete len:213 (-) Transcript_21685:102-740(-)